MVRDELSGFIAALNKYHAGDDRQQYLSLWSGTVIKADRKVGGTAFAYRPAAGIYAGIQPDVANRHHNENGERDGMVERFLLFRPEVYPSGWTDDEVDYSLLPPVIDMLNRLRQIEIREDLDGDRITVQLHPEAKRGWVTGSTATKRPSAG